VDVIGEQNLYAFNIDFIRVAISLIVILLLSLLSNLKNRIVLDFLLNLSIIFNIIPMAVMYSAADKSPLFFMYSVLGYLAILIFSKVNIRNIRFCRSISLVGAMNFMAFITPIFLLINLIYVGLDGLSYDIDLIYKNRVISSEKIGIIMGYINPALGEVVIPMLAVTALNNKNYINIFLAFFYSVIMFGITNQKGVIFYPFLAITIFYISININRVKNFNSLIIGMAIFSAIQLFIIKKLDFDLKYSILGIFIDRSFFTPANINYMYYEYFDINNLIFWKNSKITFGLMDFDGKNPANVIGVEFFNNPDTFANTGWIGSGFMHAGLLGIIIYGAVIGLIFSYVARFSDYNRIRLEVLLGSIAVPVIGMLISTDLTAVLLTGGLILQLIFLGTIKE
jgi:hypothetical protein